MGLNEALREARGEILNFCADDDVMRPDALQRVHESIGSALWCYGQAEFSTGPVMGGPWDHERLKRVNFIPCPATFWRRDAGLEFDLSIPIAYDYDMWHRLAARGTPVYIPHVLTWYRIHEGQASIIHRQQEARDAAMIAERAQKGFYAVNTPTTC